LSLAGGGGILWRSPAQLFHAVSLFRVQVNVSASSGGIDSDVECGRDFLQLLIIYHHQNLTSLTFIIVIHLLTL